jgi:hypothetical protein
VLDLEDNLLSGITRGQIEPFFAAGAGRELDEKMRAPWSSCALAVNSFAPWRKDLRLLHLVGLTGFGGEMRFEARCPNGVSRISPHLDVLPSRGEGLVAVESKCLEYVRTKRQVPAYAYRALAEAKDARASSAWFAVLDRLYEFF